MLDEDIRTNYSKVIAEINPNTIVLFRLFVMKLTERGKELREQNDD